MSNMDFFYNSIRQSLFRGSLSQSQVDGCNYIVSEWERRGLSNRNQLAYVLATAFHETGGEMQSIRERGGDQYFKDLYDIEGNNPSKARDLGNDQPGDGVKYHGRGFVMITGKYNYRTFGNRYHLDLVADPEIALELEVSINILFDGMLEGLFTGKRLSNYITDHSCDYVGARRIVNGRDRAQEIAQYATYFESALTAPPAANQAEDLVIRDLRNEDKVISPCTVRRVVLVNCEGVKLDLRNVKYTERTAQNMHIVEIRGGKNNVISNITHHCDYSSWTADDWEKARQGVKVGGMNNRVKSVMLKGVRFGVELVGIGAKAHHVNVIGFSYDAIRMTANRTELGHAVIKDAFLANPDNHSDAIQLFPQADPSNMSQFSLENIKVQDVDISNDSTKPGGNWMQGVFLTDGRIHNSLFENISVNSDHQHGLSFAEAHDCTLRDVNCFSPDPDVISHISVNTRKPGYSASRKVRLQKCGADLILID